MFAYTAVDVALPVAQRSREEGNAVVRSERAA